MCSILGLYINSMTQIWMLSVLAIYVGTIVNLGFGFGYLPIQRLKNKITTYVGLWQHHGLTLEGCSIYCYKDKRCKSFFYRSGSNGDGICQGHLMVFSAASMQNMNDAEDTVYFAQEDEVCPSNWERLGTSCYIFNLDIKTWISAEASCQKQGGYLAEITSSKEQNLISNYIQNIDENIDYFTGASRQSMTEPFKWQDSNIELDYTNWLPGQPSNEHQNCVVVSWGWAKQTKWDNFFCSLELRYICEKNL